jgi:molybdate transport system substrate-binding protein
VRILLIFIILFAPTSLLANDIHLVAAASLREVAAEAKAVFEQRHPEHRILVNSASSGALARQIAAGAPADIFLSANPQWMEYLVQKQKVAADQPFNWVSNHLVVVGRGAGLQGMQDLALLGKLAIGSPESAPVGRYARGMLQRAQLYRKLENERRLVFAKDVNQALLYAEKGLVDAAIVYASDVRRAEQSMIRLVPENFFQPQIVYPIALTRHGQLNPAAAELFAFLISTAGAHLAADFGFFPLTRAGGKQ